MTYFTIDGTPYPGVFVRTPIKRKATVRDGGNAGYTISGAYSRDVKGTYYTYSMTLDCMSVSADDYTALYQALTAPVNAHTVTVPYNQTTLQFIAMISTVSDNLVKRHNGINIWRNLTVTFTAIEPTRYPS